MVVGEMVFDTLVYRDPTTFQHKPLLAIAWRWVDDLTLEFDLRDGVVWQDGVPFTADDVLYTYNYITNPANKIWRIQWASWIKSTEVVGPHKVRLHLAAPFGPALEYLAQLLPILPKDFYGAGGKAGGNGRLIGTGPYRITSFQQGKEARFEKNTKYFQDGPKGAPTISRMMFRNIPDPATQVAELVAGGLDWVWRVPADQLADLSARPGLAVATGGTMRTFWVGFDARKPPFNDARVRRAVGYAIDRKALATQLMGEGTKVLEVPCYPTQFGCIDAGKVPHFELDPVKAKSLVTEVSPSGVNTTMVIYAQGQNRDVAEAIQGYLRPIGIKADLNVTTIKGFFDATPQEGKVPLKLESYGQYNINDVSILLPGYYDGGTQDTVRDAEITEWLKQAAAASDAAKRKELYEQVDRKIIDQAYWIPLFIQNVNYAFNKDFGFHPWPDEDPRFYMTKWK
jgi:peptide/nickel transport system substrate-binding protein